MILPWTMPRARPTLITHLPYRDPSEPGRSHPAPRPAACQPDNEARGIREDSVPRQERCSSWRPVTPGPLESNRSPGGAQIPGRFPLITVARVPPYRLHPDHRVRGARLSTLPDRISTMVV